MILHPAHLTDLLITVGIIGAAITGLIFYTRIVARNVAAVRDNHLLHQAETLDKIYDVTIKVDESVNRIGTKLDGHLEDHLRGRV